MSFFREVGSGRRTPLLCLRADRAIASAFIEVVRYAGADLKRRGRPVRTYLDPYRGTRGSRRSSCARHHGSARSRPDSCPRGHSSAGTCRTWRRAGRGGRGGGGGSEVPEAKHHLMASARKETRLHGSGAYRTRWRFPRVNPMKDDQPKRAGGGAVRSGTSDSPRPKVGPAVRAFHGTADRCPQRPIGPGILNQCVLMLDGPLPATLDEESRRSGEGHTGVRAAHLVYSPPILRLGDFPTRKLALFV